MHEAARTQLVLVVDDHDLVRNLVVTILEKGGFEVLAAASGQQALEVYAERMDEIACVLLDLSMPKMSGPQVLEALKEHDPDVKVVLMSAHDESAGAVLIEEAGAIGYLRKPFRPEALVATVADVLAGSTA